MLMKFWALQQAKRERRQYEFKSIKLSNKLQRIEKNITNIQKMYQKRQTQIESQAKMAQSAYEAQIRSQSGLSGASSSIFGGYAGAALGGCVASAMSSLFTQYLSSEVYKNEGDKSKKLEQGQFENYIKSGVTTGLSSAQQEILGSFRSQAAQQVQNWMTQEINNMQMWIENQKQILIDQNEEEQEAALLPLNEEQTQDELEESFIKTRLEELKERIKTLESECSEEAKDMAPKFGLG